MNNHWICVEYVWITHWTYIVDCVHLCRSISAWKSVFLISCIFMNFEFLSTTINQCTSIQIENLFIVNNINKINYSWFKNIQAHCQRTSERWERSDQRRMQIHDFRTLISRMYRTPLTLHFMSLRHLLHTSIGSERSLEVDDVIKNLKTSDIFLCKLYKDYRWWTHFWGVSSPCIDSFSGSRRC